MTSITAIAIISVAGLSTAVMALTISIYNNIVIRRICSFLELANNEAEKFSNTVSDVDEMVDAALNALKKTTEIRSEQND